jgi:hypothetical protein
LDPLPELSILLAAEALHARDSAHERPVRVLDGVERQVREVAVLGRVELSVRVEVMADVHVGVDVSGEHGEVVFEDLELYPGNVSDRELVEELVRAFAGYLGIEVERSRKR